MHISELVDKIYTDLDEKQLPIAIFIDSSKAFDTIDHQRIYIIYIFFVTKQSSSANWSMEFRTTNNNKLHAQQAAIC